MDQPKTRLKSIPRGIWALGFVSLLMDVSSERIHSLLPVFMLTVLGASALMIGLIEGAAEATALIVKVFSGMLSDYWGKRKPLAVFGYGLGALSKPLFAIAGSLGMVFTARMVDRIGKGVRGEGETRWWLTSFLSKCAVQPSVCASPWTRWVHSWGCYLPWVDVVMVK